MATTAEVLKALVDTVEATGGVIEFNGRLYGCAVDPDWLDLAEVAVRAKDVLETEYGISVPLTVRVDFEP